MTQTMRLITGVSCRGDEPDNTAMPHPLPSPAQRVSRHRVLQHAATATAGGLLIGATGAAGPRRTQAASASATPADARPSDGTALQPRDAIGSILAAMDRFPLVGLGERHLLQEMHDVLTALLRHPALPGKITDIVVEFGNALHQDLADRFILGDQPVPSADLAQLWRFTIGGNVLWDAPVYEQFFRTVRAVNWMLPAARRIRVLLGDPPFDHRRVRSVADKDYVLSMIAQRDAHYAAVVEQRGAAQRPPGAAHRGQQPSAARAARK